MLKQTCVIAVLCLCVFSGCALSSESDAQPRVLDVHIHDRNHIVPDHLYAAVGEEIRWHNLLSVPVHLGFLGVKPIKEVGCGKGFTTWYGGIKDMVMIPAGEYVSVCFTRTGTVRYNIWTDLGDPLHSISPTAVIHLEAAA
ncbi:MAG: hypothetical protein OEW25_12640 [Nitrospira sp.]|nr:hypothetical protein [Nitrospira sp.]MDH4328725.1 hypothetical protein [Nitrospira sp.]MDH5254165.1 hypothetical protein [Nitrospira sp.]